MRPPPATAACRTHHHCVVLMEGGYSGAIVGWAKAQSAVPTRGHTALRAALPTLQFSRIRRRREEAAARAVRSLAAPERAVGRGLGFGERHRLHLEQVITVRAEPHALARNDETVALAAAPFARAVAQAAAGNPAVVGGAVGGDEEEGSKDKRKPQMKSG